MLKEFMGYIKDFFFTLIRFPWILFWGNVMFCFVFFWFFCFVFFFGEKSKIVVICVVFVNITGRLVKLNCCGNVKVLNTLVR